jgi:molybdopterin/thiamine biosynthesis adenylyltransferase
MSEHDHFSPSLAFSRNIGWLTPHEQEQLSKVRVGILGAGGVGGQYAEILARLGVREFVIWDPDEFSIENTNRQNQCQASTYGRKKAEVLAELIRDINPTATVRSYATAMTKDELDGFCKSIDFYFDGLDFFETDIRIAVFRALRHHQRPAITVAPVGTGASALLFTDRSMSFDDYFGLHLVQDPVVRSIYFLTGLTPTLMQRRYLVDQSRTDLAKKQVPSLGIGVYTAASMAATTFLKVVLQRGPVRPAPWSLHFDPYLGELKSRYTFWGYRNPIQMLKRWIAMKVLKTRPT